MEDDERARAEARDRARRLSEARSEYEALLVSVEESAPRGAMLLGTGATRASELQGALQPGEVLLEYMVTPERLVVFVVSPEEIRLAETDISADELATRVRLARELLRRPATPADGALEVLEGLHRVLVEPAIRAAAIRRASRLVLVPHEALTYLPFGALRDATTGRYLAEQFSLLYLPSAAALTALRVRGPPQDGARSQASALAPFPDQLPGSVAEARAVAARLAGTRELLGGEATEARARAALAGRGVVHLATHGVMNPRNPMFSRIELRGEARESSEFDGRLEVHEILGLSIASPLVFLSGCDTGVGAAWSSRFIQGEDYATLARAFLYAGAVNVIATLWPLHDEGAGAFAEFFYRELEAARPAEALARAQRAMLSSERFRSPFYWAGYRLSGSGI